MKARILISLLAIFLCVPAKANPDLLEKEKTALDIAKTWSEGNGKPITDGSGRVKYFYGESLPTVICSPLKTCVIELEPGEIVPKSGLAIGDQVRWKVMPTVVGAGEQKKTALIVKPVVPDVETSMTVATTRRVYQIKLLSHESEWMPYVSFMYPEEVSAAWSAYQAAVKEEHRVNVLPGGLSVPELDFNYLVKGKGPFKPLRVYNDGVKTIIEMPLEVERTRLPTVLVVNGSQQELVNYRYKNSYVDGTRRINGRFIVDQISKELILVSGVGSDQISVLIRYKG
ncbi:P-type conjugative transfer protein TrbG [Shewanella algae]|jgi:type IV secretion system protein VirB9|uniref:P-type conjugative transfer protein TrbG n=1 Tax=Shewanella algae TaxID=38313 RepID=UPI001183F447|nr:P-type conjugative transfer protein TrbG [Shewanella algae]MBO2558943.1 P-type conjugative transfer protein TrbG [Shewanella algae]MBO2575904.1 P-type conjugative transfer protein TrbG [Shewanella algae]TVO83396.1 P-type conjugative transfer protein TrbG [Shewanella algae]TXS83015.1 P-type conjugative transfer protein TrbG [Shewanella algae]